MANPVVRFEIGAAEDQPLVEFYGELFGWGLREVSEGYTLIDTRGGRVLNGGIGRSDSGEPWATFYVEVEDLQAALDRAEALGGRTVLPDTELPGMAFAMFDDPDGLLVGLVKAEPPPEGAPQGRPHEHLEGHERAHRVARQRHHRQPLEDPAALRPARLHLHPSNSQRRFDPAGSGSDGKPRPDLSAAVPAAVPASHSVRQLPSTM